MKQSIVITQPSPWVCDRHRGTLCWRCVGVRACTCAERNAARKGIRCTKSCFEDGLGTRGQCPEDGTETGVGVGGGVGAGML